MGQVLKMMVAFIAAFIVFTFPATWLLMLFLGNIGMELSYVAVLPLGIVTSLLISGATTRS